MTSLRLRPWPAAVLFLVVAPLQADVLFVDAAAPGPGTGSVEDPFTTIQAALDVLPAGGSHQIRVAAGEYPGFVDPATSASLLILGAGAQVTSVGPLQAGPGTYIAFLSIEANGGVAVTGAGGAILDTCVVSGGSTGVLGSMSVWTTTLVSNGVGLDGPVDVTDCLLFGNGIDIVSPGVGCSNLWQTWQHPTQGFLTQAFDPLFWDFEEGDYHLRPGSPCIGVGCWVNDIGALAYDPDYAPAPVVYCTSKTSSDSCTPAVSWTGSQAASFSSNAAFVVTASGVSEFKNGTFFYGLAPLGLPYQGGWLCVQPPTSRTPLQSSGTGGGSCSGSFAFDFSAFAQSGAAPFLAPGMSIYGQYWYRDPGDPFQSARTDAIEFGLLE